jgi:hypothetical protein
MFSTTSKERYRVPLCPYLAVGNRRVLVHLDAYFVPQSLQWPRPGAVDRLGWRDGLDEWPYWDEMDAEAVKARMPYFEYESGQRDYLHEAVTVSVDYIEDTNVLAGRYELPGGATVAITTFVMPGDDVWVRRYEVTGDGKFVHQSEFFEKAVRFHPCADVQGAEFKGGFLANPRGAYVLVSEKPLAREKGKIAIMVSGKHTWSINMCMAGELGEAVELGRKVIAQGYESAEQQTISADREWIAKAKEPVNTHRFVTGNYKRWLLANIMLLGADGAMVCGARPFWGFCWPRDCAILAAGFAAAGFFEEAQSIVKWHLDNTPESCIHAARYHTDREPVTIDGRLRQGDNPGWLSWAASFVCRQKWDKSFIKDIKDNVFALVDLLVEHRDEETLLMPPESDWSEGPCAETICIAVTSISGLEGAVHIAEKLGISERAAIYKKRVSEINKAVESYLWDEQGQYFIRSVKPLDKATDMIACWGIYSVNAWSGADPKLKSAFKRLQSDRWNEEAGGMLVAEGTEQESLWQWHTGLFLLAAAEIGDENTISKTMASLEKNSSPQGLIPEQISGTNGHLWGCNYLATSQACLLLFAYKKA